MEGGLWDSSNEIFPLFGARGLSSSLRWYFPSGATIRMAHLEHEKTRFSYQGSQIPFIGFDELTHFTYNQFWYLMSRNRSGSGVRPLIRAGCNPDPDGWVRKLIDWWIDPETGFAIKERSGVIRWFIRKNGRLEFSDTKEQLEERFGVWDPIKKRGCLPKSLTFIRADIFDNQIGLEKDPDYLANLEALPLVDREQLLKGNWNVRPSAGNVFKSSWFGVVEAAPADAEQRVRYWDRAATEQKDGNDPDATCGLLLSRDRRGVFYVEDVRHMRASAFTVDTAIVNTAAQDGVETTIGYMQDPGSAGKAEAQQMARMLAGYSVKFAVASGDKLTRAKPASSQAEAGNIKIVRGRWNEEFLRELENFPPPGTKGHDDQVDALSGAMEILSGRGGSSLAVNPAGRKEGIVSKPRPGRRIW
jgi:predicted phage terminase large subunit-like protein